MMIYILEVLLIQEVQWPVAFRDFMRVWPHMDHILSMPFTAVVWIWNVSWRQCVKGLVASCWAFGRWLGHEDCDIVNGLTYWQIHNLMALLGVEWKGKCGHWMEEVSH
jgi:hypothetical protein